MNLTYSERRQRAYFDAAVAMYKVASEVLEDVRNEVELRSATTNTWVASVSRATMNRARELEEKGHEEAVATDAQERRLQKAKDKHSDVLTAYLARRKTALQREDAVSQTG